jgi:hypothetical protein
VNTRKIGRLGMLAVGLGLGAAMAHSPVASADASNDWLSSVDSFLGGLSPAAATPVNIDISFDGMTIYDGGGTATATTVAGQYGLAIAEGDHANAVAEGGTGNYALADGTYALAKAGSEATGATNSSYDSAIDIGNNPVPNTITGAPDGAYAGGGSLIGGVDSGTAGSSHDTAYDIGNNTGTITTPGDFDGGNSGAFAGDGQLIGLSGAGNGDTAYTAGDINGFGDGSASVDGNNNYASTSGSETGQNEGAFAGLGNNNSAIADTSYTEDGSGVSATAGNGNYAYVFGPDNSTADAGGASTVLGSASTELGNNNISYVWDPFASATSEASNAISGSGYGVAGSNDLAEVLLTHGNAFADGGNFLYDIVSLFGNIASP